ncbi:Glycerate dehydrogenase [Phycisphaerae bacterium RAS1]|nr:Glycerate dehydrogenase [Phycisphaerae bacterium RAS1]
MRVLLTRRMPPDAAELLSGAGFAVELIDAHESPPADELRRRAAGVDAILCTLSERIDAPLLDAAGSRLRIVANLAVGYENIDVDACRARRVWATNTPGVLTDATADLTWALILATARRVVEGDALVRRGAWPGWAPLQLLGRELRGATLGVVGAGRIGAAVGTRAAPFGMNVIYAHPRVSPELEAAGARRVTLSELLAASDFVSLHVPMREENRRLIGRPQLAAMKPGAILINTARGAVIDEAALVEGLRAGRPAAAGLDVYEREPRLSPGLAELPNVVLLPHLGSATTQARSRMAEMAARNIIAALSGRQPPNPIGGASDPPPRA